MKENKYLTENLHSILIGLMLGDAGIYKSSMKSNSRLEMSFGTKYKQYAENIENLFIDYIKNPIKQAEIKVDNKIYINYRLKTKTLPLFNVYHNMFYVLNTDTNKFVKVVPNDIENLMNPIVLAYLIQGDGNFDKGRNRVRIYTNSYTKEEVKNLSLAINENLNIYSSILHDRKDQWIITIGAKQLDKLRKLLIPYFCKSMLYRIGV